MGDGPLQGEHGRERVGVVGVALDLRCRHEAEVIVAVRHLGCPAGIDDVDLGRHLVRRTEPRGRHEVDDVVAVVVDEDGRISDSELFQGVPDPIVGAGLGEMIAHGLPGSILLIDDAEEDLRRAIHDRRVDGSLDDDDARSVTQGSGQLVKSALPLGTTQAICGVHQDIGLDAVRKRVVGELGLLCHDRSEVLEPAVHGAQHGPIQAPGPEQYRQLGHARGPGMPPSRV